MKVFIHYLLKNIFYFNILEPSKDQHYFSAYNESIFFDWKEISLQRRILKLYNLDPNQNYLLQEDELFKENNIFLGLADGIDSISWDRKY